MMTAQIITGNKRSDDMLDMIRTMRKTQGEDYTLLVLFLHNFSHSMAMQAELRRHALNHMPEDHPCKAEIQKVGSRYEDEIMEGMVPIVFRMFALLKGIPRTAAETAKLGAKTSRDVEALVALNTEGHSIILTAVMEMLELEDVLVASTESAVTKADSTDLRSLLAKLAKGDKP